MAPPLLDFILNPVDEVFVGRALQAASDGGRRLEREDAPFGYPGQQHPLSERSSERELRMAQPQMKRPRRPSPKSKTHIGEGSPVPKLWRNQMPKAAICLVGLPRTLLTRSDQSSGLRYNVLAPWSSGDADLFAVLSRGPERPEERPGDDTVGRYEAAVARAMQELSPVEWAWYDDQQEVETLCDGNYQLKYRFNEKDKNQIAGLHKAAQARQWAQCFGMVEAHEAVKGKRFRYDLVMKLRPDDLWFGPLPPLCSMAPNVAIVSHQASRFSDQWFVLPRSMAKAVFTCIHEWAKEGSLKCRKIPKEKGAAVMLLPGFSEGNRYSFHFEDTFHSTLMKEARAKQIKVTEVILPRILTREPDTNSSDAKSKCQKFFRFLPLENCMELAEGRPYNSSEGK